MRPRTKGAKLFSPTGVGSEKRQRSPPPPPTTRCYGSLVPLGQGKSTVIFRGRFCSLKNFSSLRMFLSRPRCSESMRSLSARCSPNRGTLQTTQMTPCRSVLRVPPVENGAQVQRFHASLHPRLRESQHHLQGGVTVHTTEASSLL